METVGKRLYWLDAAKAIGIFLVVLGHVPSVYNYRWVIYLFHMPLFFMLSGYLFKFVSPKEELKRSFKSLLVPYFIYSSVLLVLWTWQKGKIDLGLIGLVITGNLNSIANKATSIMPLWFLLSLFSMRMIASVFGRNTTKITPPLFMIICMIGGSMGGLRSLIFLR